MQGFVGIRDLGGIQAVLRSMVLAIAEFPRSRARFGRWLTCALRRGPGSWSPAFSGHFTR